MNNFIFLGDSITFGYGIHYNECWVSRIAKTIPNFNIINAGINGDTTSSMLFRCYDDVTAYSPHSLFIMGGTNDLLCGRSIESIINNIEELIFEYKDKIINLYIGVPPYIKKDMAEKLFMPSSFYNYCEQSLPILRKNLIKLCEKHSIKYIDFYKITFNNIDKNIYIDGIHLNFLGNTLLFNEAIKVFNK